MFWPPAVAPVRPPLISAKSYWAASGQLANTAIAAADVLIGYLWRPGRPLSITDLHLRVQTGAPGSAAKVGVWSLGGTARPIGTPLIFDNTAQATTAGGTLTFPNADGVLGDEFYFWASMYTGGTPTMTGLSLNTAEQSSIVGGSPAQLVATSVVALTTPVTFADNIGALDLTAVTMTEANNTGTPIVGYTAA